MDIVSELLKGAIDVHVHSGPGVIPRSLDHFEAVQQCLDAGMKGLILKDQHGMTANQAYLLKKYVFKNAPIHIFGGMPLNNATGGISVHAVNAAITYGAKIIWMPTMSAKNHIEFHKHHKSFFSKHERKDLAETPLTILGPDKKLLPQIKKICELIAEADVILGTGHLYLEEIKLLVDAAIKIGVKKILMQHPEFVINASIDDMIELADKGVFIEHSYTTVISKSVTKEYLFEMIREVGANRTIVGSDLGQEGRIYPVEGLRNFIKEMLDMGLEEEEIDWLLRKNPAKLLNLS
jgi:hypothetical protein